MERKNHRNRLRARSAPGAASASLKSKRIAAAVTLVSIGALIAMFVVSTMPPDGLRWMDSDLIRTILALAIALELGAAIFLAWGTDAEDE